MGPTLMIRLSDPGRVSPQLPSRRVSAALLAALTPFAATALADHPAVSLEQGGSGPIVTTSAQAQEKGSFDASFQTQIVDLDDFSDAELTRFSALGEEVHSVDSVTSLSLGGVYGATDAMSLGFSLPYLWRSEIREAAHHGQSGPAHRHGPEMEGGVENFGSSAGLGDLTVYGKYRLVHLRDAGFHLAGLAGLKMPTGRTDARTLAGTLFEAEHQPGSGSWDPLAGLALTRQHGQWSFDANVLFTRSTKGTQDTILGDIFNYNLALTRRVLGGDARATGEAEDSGKAEAGKHGHPLIWDLVLEINGDWRERVNIAGVEDPNTGGNMAFLAAGQRLAWGDGWSAALLAGVPVVNDLNGIQSEPRGTVLLGVSKGF